MTIERKSKREKAGWRNWENALRVLKWQVNTLMEGARNEASLSPGQRVPRWNRRQRRKYVLSRVKMVGTEQAAGSMALLLLCKAGFNSERSAQKEPGRHQLVTPAESQRAQLYFQCESFSF